MVRILPAALVVAASLLTGCPEHQSARVRLIEASALAENGEVDEARQVFQRLLTEYPDRADVLTQYAGFLVGTGELDRAADVFERLGEMELRGTERTRLDAERRRYFERIYRDARGPGPEAPADPEAYERGLIGLIALERTGPMLDEYGDYLIMQARAALGHSPESPIALPADELVAAATGEQVHAALDDLDRLLDGDDRVDVHPEPEGTRLAEATGLRDALRLELFRVDFEERWSTRYRDAFARDGRFDPASRRFLHRYVGPYREGFDAGSGEARLLHQAQTWHAREVATDICYELAGVPREGAPPLDYRVEDFATTEVSGLGEDAEGRLVFDLAIPYATVLQGGLLLRHRLRAERAERDVDGSGSGSEP